jgi:hypothetical protein
MGDHDRYAAVRTGDILLFAGYNSAALILRTATWGEYTHAGIAVWLELDLEATPTRSARRSRRLYCFEAGPCPLPDALSPGHALKRGCRLADIDEIMSFYCRLAVRHISVPRDRSFYATLRAFMEEYHPRSFRSLFQLAVMSSGLVGPPHDADGSIFCSELCSTWLARIGVLKAPILRDVPHHRSCPADLARSATQLAITQEFVYPADAFTGPAQIVQDDGQDGPARTAIAFALFAAFCAYATITISYSKP